MSDSKKEIYNSDDEDKTPKSSNTKEKDDKSEKQDELTSENKIKSEESLTESDTKNEQTSDADVTTAEDSKPPVSICFKETNEIFSKESQELMIEDVRNFFLNLKELQSKRASTETLKRKCDSTLEDSDEKSNLSDDCTQPAKKLLLDASTTEGISPRQSQAVSEISEHSTPAAVVSISAVNSGSSLISVSSEAIAQEPSVMEHSTGSHFSPEDGSEEHFPVADQPNTPEGPRSEESHSDSELAPRILPAEPMAVEYHDQSLVELNGVKSHHFPGIVDVQMIVPLFQCFLNDMLEIRSFLDGQVSFGTPEEADASSEIELSDRQLASMTDSFGTGVESEAARITKEVVNEWDTKYISKSDSECLSGYSEQSEYSDDSTQSGNSTHRIDAESNSNETEESPTLSPDPTQICSESAVLTTQSSQLKPEIADSSTLENKQDPKTSEDSEQSLNQNFESESSSNETAEKDTNPIPSSEQMPTVSPRFHAELDHLNLPSQISPLLRALNTKGRKLLNNCIETSKNFLRTCLMTGASSFQGTLLEHMRGVLDTMRRLISLREDCSYLLKECSDKNSLSGVTYILKVKYYISKVYGQLLEDFLAMNISFQEVVKEKISVDSVD